MTHTPEPPKNIIFRRATLSDVETIVDFRVRFLSEFLETLEGKDFPSLKKKLADYFRKTIPSGEFISFIAEIDGEPVGCSELIRWQHIPGFKENSENRGYIFNMYTVPESRAGRESRRRWLRF